MRKRREEPVGFETEVRQRFQCLVDDYDMPEPTYTEDLFPVVRYARPGLWVSVSWGTGSARQRGDRGERRPADSGRPPGITWQYG